MVQVFSAESPVGAPRARPRYADGSPPAAADGRLLHLDWAVRAGRLVLADRAAQGLTSTEVTAQPWRGIL